MVANDCNPCIWEVKIGGFLQVCGQIELDSEFYASQGTRMRLCLKIQKNNNVANTDLRCCPCLLKMMNGVAQAIPRRFTECQHMCYLDTSRIYSLLWWLVLSAGQDLGPRRQPSRFTCEDLDF